MRRLGFILLLVCCSLGLLACGAQLKMEEVTDSTLLLKKNGTVQTIVIETLDKDYYDVAEMQQYITDSLQTYNEEQGEGCVVLEAIEATNNQIKAKFTYKTIDDYSRLQMEEMILLRATEAKKEGYPTEYFNTEGNPVALDVVAEKEKYKLLVLENGNMEIRVDGIIQYYANGTLESKNTLFGNAEGKVAVVYK